MLFSGVLFDKPLDLLDHVMAGLLDYLHILDQSFCRVAIMQQIVSGKLAVYAKEFRHDIGN